MLSIFIQIFTIIGSTSVLINMEIKKEWALMDLFQEIVNFDEFILEDSNKQNVLKELQYYFSSVIKKNDVK